MIEIHGRKQLILTIFLGFYFCELLDSISSTSNALIDSSINHFRVDKIA